MRSFDRIENAAVPLARLAVAGDAILRVPAAAVDFPRHPRVAADFVDVEVVRRACYRPRRGRTALRSTNGPAASTGARATAVWETSADCGVRSADFDASLSASSFRLPPSALRTFHNLLRRSARHDVPAVRARFRAQVDDPVGRLDHVEIVLDHDDRVALVDEAIEHFEQLGQVVEVQAGGRLVEQVQRLAGVRPSKLGRQFHALRFAAGERRRALAEREVIEPDVAQRLQDAADLRDVARTAPPPAPHDMSSTSAMFLPWNRTSSTSRVVALAAARFALDPHIGQEVHLDANLAVAFARLAAPARHVEAEPPGRVAAQLRLGQLRRTSWRISSNTPVYVAGFDVGVLPSGC